MSCRWILWYFSTALLTIPFIVSFATIWQSQSSFEAISTAAGMVYLLQVTSLCGRFSRCYVSCSTLKNKFIKPSGFLKLPLFVIATPPGVMQQETSHLYYQLKNPSWFSSPTSCSVLHWSQFSPVIIINYRYFIKSLLISQKYCRLYFYTIYCLFIQVFGFTVKAFH